MFYQWKQCCECGTIVPAIARCIRTPDCGYAYRYMNPPAPQFADRRHRHPVTLEASGTAGPFGDAPAPAA